MAIKKLISAVAAALGLAAAAPASAIIVGGIDFGALGTTQHLETSTLAETVVTGVGDTLQGYGKVNTVNGANNYCADGSTNCSLYFYFHDYTVSYFDGNKVEFTGGVVDLYYSGAPAVNLFNQDSPSNVALIQSFTPWAQLLGHTFIDPIFNGLALAGDTYTLNGNGVLTGASLSENGAGLLDSNVGGSFGMASVLAYLNGNSELDGLGGAADIVLGSNSNSSRSRLNPHDTCPAPTAPLQSGSWCLQGTLDTSGATAVPEPATLALLGVGLIGLGFTQRKRWS